MEIFLCLIDKIDEGASSVDDMEIGHILPKGTIIHDVEMPSGNQITFIVDNYYMIADRDAAYCIAYPHDTCDGNDLETSASGLNKHFVMPSFSFANYTKQKGDCDDCVLREHCKPHCSSVTFEGTEYACPLKFEENWA